MMNTNLLDLDNDILNIIGDYVKEDNIARMKKEKFKHDSFEYLNKRLKEDRKYCRQNNTYMSRNDTRNQLFFSLKCFAKDYFNDDIDDEIACEIMKCYNEYLKLKKLNLKEEF